MGLSDLQSPIAWHDDAASSLSRFVLGSFAQPARRELCTRREIQTHQLHRGKARPSTKKWRRQWLKLLHTSPPTTKVDDWKFDMLKAWALCDSSRLADEAGMSGFEGRRARERERDRDRQNERRERDHARESMCKIPLYNPTNPEQPRDQSLSPVTTHSSFFCASSSRPVLCQCHSALLHSQVHREH